MEQSISKDLLSQVFKKKDFKEWLVSRRWFANKSELADLQYEIFLDFFKVIDGKIIITIINVKKGAYSRQYFVPFLHFKNIDTILEESEKSREKAIRLQENSFLNELNLIEAEYCLFFWKKILLDVNFVKDFPERFQYVIDAVKDLSNYELSLNQLGEGNTTNLLFELSISEKASSEQKQESVVLKSYKNYAENLEILKLKTLMKNNFENAPKILGTVQIAGYNVIGLIEKVRNMGNIGSVYWDEINKLLFSEFDTLTQSSTGIKNNDQIYQLITRYCQKSLEFSSQIGQIIKKMHVALIRVDSEDENFQVEIVKSQKCLEPRLNSIHSLILNLKFTIKKLSTGQFFEVSQVNSILNDVIEVLGNILFRIRDLSIQIQPIHQDLHMEQVLYNIKTEQCEFYFIDFEGDPQLSIEEKKKKLPIEKDIASFLRSLSYIKYNTLLGYIKDKVTRKNNTESPEEILHDLSFHVKDKEYFKVLGSILNVLDTWERKLKEIVLRDLDSIKALVDFFIIERTLREINYESLYRPDKIIVPLLGLKEIIEKNKKVNIQS